MLLAYDVTAPETFEKVTLWLQEVKQFMDESSIAIAVGTDAYQG